MKNFNITKHFIAVVRSTALILGLACASSNLRAQVYDVLDMGVLPGKATSTSAAINDRGQVAGTSAAGTLTESAFFFNSVTKGPLQTIGNTPAGSVSRAFAINNSGDVVGDSTFGTQTSIRHAALFSNGSVADLGVLKGVGDFSRANGINSSGQVVGFSSAQLDSDKSRAFIWTADTGIVDLGTLGGASAQALAINDAGFVTGHSQLAPSRLAGGIHAFIYQPFSLTERPTRPMLDLGTLGGSSSYGTFLNEKNHVVGYSTLNNFSKRVHAFLHDGTKMVDLGSLGGKGLASDQSVALGINESDEVVGYSFLPTSEVVYSPRDLIRAPAQVAFVYRNGRMLDLNSLIGPAAAKYRLYSATAINDNGQITVDAVSRSTGTYRALVLSPVPHIGITPLPPVRE